MKKILLLTTLLLTICSCGAWAEGYNYVTSTELRDLLQNNQVVSILDIQYEEAYKALHFPQAIATYAYPVKTAASRAQINAKLSGLQASGPVVITSRRGGGGAMRGFDHLKTKGIVAQRLFILRKGMQAWPYPDMVISTKLDPPN